MGKVNTHNANSVKKYICATLTDFANSKVGYPSGRTNTIIQARNFYGNPSKNALAANFDQALKEEGIQLPPEVDKLYKNMKFMMDDYAQQKVAFDMARNPINLMCPEVEGLGQTLLENIDALEEAIKANGDVDLAFDNLNLRECIKEAGENLIKNEAYWKTYETKKALMAGQKDTKAFFMNKTFQVDKKDVTFEEAVQAKQNGKNVTVRDYSEAEKTALKEALKPEKIRHSNPDRAIELGEAKYSKAKTAENYDKYFEKISKVAEKLNKTNSVFSRDSKEYKNVSKSLNTMVKEYKAIKEDIKKNGLEANLDKLQKLYNSTSINSNEYIQVREEKNKVKVSSRGVERIKILKELEGIESPKMGLEYNDKPLPERSKVERDQIERDYGGDEEKYDKVMAQIKENQKILESYGIYK